MSVWSYCEDKVCQCGLTVRVKVCQCMRSLCEDGVCQCGPTV